MTKGRAYFPASFKSLANKNSFKKCAFFICFHTDIISGKIRQIYCDYDFDLTVSNAIAAADPLISTTPWYSTDGISRCAAFRNASGYSNPVLDEIVEQAALETNAVKRKALLAEFQRIAMRDIPLLHLVDIGMANVVNVKVHNYSFTTQWMFDNWMEVWVEK